MLGILSNNFPSQRTAQHAHQIIEAATLIKQLRKRPCSEAWGTCKEPWGFAGSLGCLQAMHQPHVLCPCSNLSVCCYPFSSKTFSVKNKRPMAREGPCFISAAYPHELLRWPQHYYENDSTSWSFQTLAFAMIWNCWKRAPLLKCSDTVCLSSIKTSKIHGTSETCTTWKSLRGQTFRDPGPRWNHRSSTYLSNTLALNIPK